MKKFQVSGRANKFGGLYSELFWPCFKYFEFVTALEHYVHKFIDYLVMPFLLLKFCGAGVMLY